MLHNFALQFFQMSCVFALNKIQSLIREEWQLPFLAGRLSLNKHRETFFRNAGPKFAVENLKRFNAES